MDAQLILLEDEGPDWRLDERTRERGRRGVAAARAALEKATRQVASAA
ncbi:MAG: hypothetical protein M3P85_10035 [Actinomycetota bacterium]|jgi:hypothetical protein|nr:hypothetical protein [Actinomycetota bacterium]